MRDESGAGAAPRARVVVAATAGIFVEAFDWTLYGLVAPYLSVQMFPGDDAFAKVVGSYAVFAAGFLARPLGSALMGRIADTRGRRAGLTTSVALMAAGALVIAATPGFAAIGWAAPAVVFLARLLQGVAMGGEIATAATYVVEVAPRPRRHLFGSIAYSGDALGSLGAAVVLAVLLGSAGRAGLEAGWWRAAFVVGAGLGLTAWWIRRRAPESRALVPAGPAGLDGPDGKAGPDVAGRGPGAPGPVLALLRPQAARMLLVFGITVGSTVGVYFATVYLPQFAAATGRLTEAAATRGLTPALLTLLVTMIAAGALADRFGPLALIRAGFTLLALTTPPLMLGLVAGRVPYLLAACVFCAGLGLQLGVTPVAGARLFPAGIRAVALGVPAAVAVATFGGTLPLVGAWLVRSGHLSTVVWYVTGAVTASAIGSWLLSERLLGEDEPLPAAGHRSGTGRVAG